jgi:hypothetical protein
MMTEFHIQSDVIQITPNPDYTGYIWTIGGGDIWGLSCHTIQDLDYEDIWGRWYGYNRIVKELINISIYLLEPLI